MSDSSEIKLIINAVLSDKDFKSGITRLTKDTSTATKETDKFHSSLNTVSGKLDALGLKQNPVIGFLKRLRSSFALISITIGALAIGFIKFISSISKISPNVAANIDAIKNGFSNISTSILKFAAPAVEVFTAGFRNLLVNLGISITKQKDFNLIVGESKKAYETATSAIIEYNNAKNNPEAIKLEKATIDILNENKKELLNLVDKQIEKEKEYEETIRGNSQNNKFLLSAEEDMKKGIYDADTIRYVEIIKKNKEEAKSERDKSIILRGQYQKEIADIDKKIKDSTGLSKKGKTEEIKISKEIEVAINEIEKKKEENKIENLKLYIDVVKSAGKKQVVEGKENKDILIELERSLTTAILEEEKKRIKNEKEKAAESKKILQEKFESILGPIGKIAGATGGGTGKVIGQIAGIISAMVANLIAGIVDAIVVAIDWIKELSTQSKKYKLEAEQWDIKFSQDTQNRAKEDADNYVEKLEREKQAALDLFDTQADLDMKRLIAGHAYTKFMEDKAAAEYAAMDQAQKDEYDLKKQYDSDVAAADKKAAEDRQALEDANNLLIKKAKLDAWKIQKGITMQQAELDKLAAISNVKRTWTSKKDDKLVEQIRAGYNEIINTIKATSPPEFARGVDEIPSDMLARVHAGERVVPASMNIPSMSNEALMASAIRGIQMPASRGGNVTNYNQNQNSTNVNNTFQVPSGTLGIQAVLDFAKRTNSRILQR